MEKKYNGKLINCGNCNKYGHKYKNCKEPITSYGVILIKMNESEKMTDEEIHKMYDSEDTKINIMEINGSQGVRCLNNSELNMFSFNKNKIQFLLIQRKHTLGYMEFIRGRYLINNVDHIVFLFQQMTIKEIDNINKMTFDELWLDLWGTNKVMNDYTISQNNFNLLKTGNSSDYLPLSFYVENVKPLWDSPEWGFPKGRKNNLENDYECAIREFEEETGLNNKQYNILNNVEPIIENLIGTNGKKYRHIYYLALTFDDIKPSINTINKHQLDEIGDIGTFNYEDALNLIRQYHFDRKKILTIVFIYILNKFVNRNEDIVVN